MTVEQAMEELKKYADEFAIMEDNDSNHENFLVCYRKVYDLYDYITKNIDVDPNSGELDSRLLETADIVESISIKNPSLSNWVDRIFLKDNI